MKEIVELLQQADSATLIAITAVLCGLIQFIFSKRKVIKKEWDNIYNARKRREELLETILTSKTKIENLEEQYDQYHQQSIDIRNGLKNDIDRIFDALNDIKTDSLDEKLSRMRWQILDFANACRNGKVCHVEQFNDVMRTYDKYESILEEHEMSNGQADESIKFIRKKYQEILNDNIENNSFEED